MRQWVQIGVVPGSGGVWTDVPIQQTYRDKVLLIRPETETLIATVTTEIANAAEDDDAALLLRRFLSAATWSTRCGFREHMRLGGSSPEPRCGRGPLVPAYHAPTHPRPRPLWAPEPDSRQALLALALYRDGMVEINRIFQYLSFFKVLETLVSGRDAIIGLAARHLPRARQIAAPFTDPQDRPTTGDLELARRLYEEGRCAIAHAHSDPLIDPDDPRDTRAIAVDGPLVRSLAEVVIEEELKVSRWPPRAWLPDWSPLQTEPLARPSAPGPGSRRSPSNIE